MSYVERLNTNIKTHSGEKRLTRCTIIAGPCGQGKSSLVDALSLALCGSGHSEGLGKAPHHLIEVAKATGIEDELELSAKVSLDTGEELSWSLKGTEEKTKRPTWTLGEEPVKEPVGVIYSRDVWSLLLGDEKKLRRALLGAAGVTIAGDKLKDTVPATQHPALFEVLAVLADGEISSTVPEKLTAADLLRTQEEASGLVRACRAEIRRMDGVQENAEPMTEEEEAELESLEHIERRKAEQDVIEEERLGLEDALGELRERRGNLLESLLDGKERALLLQRQQLFQSICETARAWRKFVEANGKESAGCPVCRKNTVTLDELEEAAARIDPELEAVHAALQPDTARREKLESVVRRVGEIEARLDELEVICDVAASTIDAKRLQELRKKRELSATCAVARTSVPALQGRLNDLQAIATAVDKQIEELAELQAATIERRMNRNFLPKKYRATVRLKDKSGKSICRVGMREGTDGPVRSFRALSNAQRATLSAAFISAIIPEDAPPVRVLVVDDVWMDGAYLSIMTKALANVVHADGGPTQAILCAVSLGSRKQPEGWSVLDLAPKRTRTKKTAQPETAEGTTVLEETLDVQ